MGGNYSREETTQGRILYKEIQYAADWNKNDQNASECSQCMPHLRIEGNDRLATNQTTAYILLEILTMDFNDGRIEENPYFDLHKHGHCPVFWLRQ